MKKIIIIVTIIVIIIIAAISTIFFATKSSRVVMEQNEELKNKMESVVLTKKEINISKITNFNWDEMYIITPYGNPKDILTKENVHWKEIDKSIEVKDDISLIIFLNDRNIVSYFNYPRQKGDFKFIKSRKFTKSSAVFKITKNNNEIELIPT